MGRPVIDMRGRLYGDLFVVGRQGSSKGKSGAATWQCACLCCGEKRVVLGSNLSRGKATGCDWKRREANVTHGHSRPRRTPTYGTWTAMRKRCMNPKDKYYADYGGRGITVCARWLSFENFLADMGERPAGRSIDRIDNARGYEPGNCRWATAREQRANQRAPRKQAAIPP